MPKIGSNYTSLAVILIVFVPKRWKLLSTNVCNKIKIYQDRKKIGYNLLLMT